MAIILVKYPEQANAITHAGVFHADDVFASVFLEKYWGMLKLYRTFDVPKDTEALIFDIGFGQFDHHQKDGNGMRDNGIMYASFGLLWKRYGKDYLRNIIQRRYIDYVWRLFDKNFVQPIDAADCGQYPHPDRIPVISVTGIIKGFNPRWDEGEIFNERFLKAFECASTIFDNALQDAISKAKAKDVVNKAINHYKDEKVLVLEQFASWHDYVLSSSKAKEMLYIVFPSARGGYNVHVIPTAFGNNNPRKPFPEKWWGLEGKQLEKACEVEGAIFCHPKGFIAAIKTLEGALKFANKAVDA